MIPLGTNYGTNFKKCLSLGWRSWYALELTHPWMQYLNKNKSEGGRRDRDHDSASWLGLFSVPGRLWVRAVPRPAAYL